MERDETCEASKAFAEMLRAKLAASRQGLRLEGLTTRRDEPTTCTEPKDKPQEDYR